MLSVQSLIKMYVHLRIVLFSSFSIFSDFHNFQINKTKINKQEEQIHSMNRICGLQTMMAIKTTLKYNFYLFF